MTCAPSEDSGQPGHPHSLIRVFAVRRVQCFFMRTAKTLVRLGNVIAGRTGNFVGFVALRLKFQRLTKENIKPNEIDMRDFRGIIRGKFTYTSSGCNWMNSVKM